MIDNSRIRLRYKRLADAKEDYAWQTDSELARLDATTPLECGYQQFCAEYTFDICYPSRHRHEFAIETTDGKHIGNCVYYNVNQTDSKTEVGIMIGNRDYWNQGYGFEAITALLSHIFNKTQLNNVYLTTLDWNTRAQKCFAKCGFNEKGQICREGYTFLLMTITRDQWESLKNNSTEYSMATGEILPGK